MPARADAGRRETKVRGMFGKLIERLDRARLRRFYRSGDYLADYARHTDARVARDPREAVGGLWDELGPLQLEFLKGEGLRPEHRLLDIGCGTLRAGRHLIRFLEPGGYTGTELSAAALEAARALVGREGLAGRAPRLVHVADGNLRFAELGGGRFDFILAHSVFTHLPAERVEEAFAHVGRAMAPGALFFFTWFDSPEPARLSPKDFAYPFAFFEALAGRHGFELADLSARYPHPRGQKMARARRPGEKP